MNPTPVDRSASDRRHLPRHEMAIPIDITVLRSGVPDSIPGRTVNFGEGGVGAILAGELVPGDSVGVELRLQGVPDPLLAKAVVRHHEYLKCGLEFQHLSPDQREIIRHWSQRSEPLRPLSRTRAPYFEAAVTVTPEVQGENSLAWNRRLLWMALAAILLISVAAAWQWHRTWQELESRVEKQSQSQEIVPKVDGSEVQQLVVHRVEPVYPEEAKRANLQGIVIISTVIGRDGSVEKVTPVSGPDVLTTAAINAVRWWRFQPYVVNGKAVEIETTLAVEFRL